MTRDYRQKLFLFCLWNGLIIILVIALQFKLSGVNYQTKIVDEYETDPGGSGYSFTGQSEERIYHNYTNQLAYNVLISCWLYNILFSFTIEAIPTALNRFSKVSLTKNQTLLCKQFSRVVLFSTPIVIADDSGQIDPLFR